jgi:uncharacterized membrane protein
MKRKMLSRVDQEVLATLLISSLVSLGLLVIRILVTGTMRLSFLAWNLILAWLPLIFAWWLRQRLSRKRPLIWQDVLIGFAWLGFLPNSFYLITDLIHLQSSGEVGLLYDTAMITSFVINGLLLGYVSLFIVHQITKRYLRRRDAYIFAQFALLLSAFAIYLGRYLRWNTWDVVINPAGLLFDVSDRIINPGSHMLTFVVTSTFFVVLGSTYAVVYRLFGLAGVHDKS